jgi:hypothetical protein
MGKSGASMTPSCAGSINSLCGAAAKLEPRLRTEAFKDMWALKETCREVQRRHLELLCYALVIVPNWKCKAGCNTRGASWHTNYLLGRLSILTHARTRCQTKTPETLSLSLSLFSPPPALCGLKVMRVVHLQKFLKC